MFAVWSVALFLLAAVPVVKDGGSPPGCSTCLSRPAREGRPVPHLCVRRFGGSRATKARPTYITVGYGGRPQQEIGSVVSKELKCFELAGGSFTVQLNSTSAGERIRGRNGARSLRRTNRGLRTADWMDRGFFGRPTGDAGRVSLDRHVEARVRTTADHPSASREEMVEKDFVVLPAIASYAEARRVAGAAARRFGLKLDLRRARPDGHGGLTFSPADCKANDWEHPCYVARGRDDDGAYVSVDEAGRFFDAEEQGYLVILGSGPKDDPSTRAVAEKARPLFPSAEIRTDDVWQGCIH